MVSREEFCFACGLLKRNGDNVATADGDHSSILLVCDKLRCRSSEPSCQHTVIRARRAATLIMPGYGDSCLLAESFFYLIGYLIRNRGMLGVFKLFAAFLLGKQPVINRSCALSDSQNREASAVAAAMLNGLQDFVYICLLYTSDAADE